MNPQWLDFAQRIQAIAQTGLSYQPHIFDEERYHKLLDIAAEMLACYSDAEIPQIHDLYDIQAGHATPKVDVRGVVFRDDAVLLVREMLDGGRWTLPGGWADINEAPSQATVREVYEESGYQTRAVKLLAFYDRRLHDHPPHMFHAYKVYFRCNLLSDERSAEQIANQSAAYIETGEIGWFREGDLPEDLSTGRVTLRQLKRFFEHLRQPELPTDFD